MRGFGAIAAKQSPTGSGQLWTEHHSLYSLHTLWCSGVRTNYGAWASLGPTLVDGLRSGARVVVHCKGGLGRAGTVACMLLLESGAASDAENAMAKVREVRRGAMETAAQEAFLRAWPASGTVVQG